jgi:hypothetical protein
MTGNTRETVEAAIRVLDDATDVIRAIAVPSRLLVDKFETVQAELLNNSLGPGG